MLRTGVSGSKFAARLVKLRLRQTRQAFKDGLEGRRQEIDPHLARLYANLELPYGADLATVVSAWKRLAREYHPDRHAGDDERSRRATELLQELNAAYRQLREHLEAAEPHPRA